MYDRHYKKRDYDDDEKNNHSSFETYKAEVKIVVSDMYGRNTEKAKIMNSKIDKCTNETQISNVMAWGRVNLL